MSCFNKVKMSGVQASHLYQGLDNLWLRYGTVENKSGQNRATISPVFCAMI